MFHSVQLTYGSIPEVWKRVIDIKQSQQQAPVKFTRDNIII